MLHTSIALQKVAVFVVAQQTFYLRLSEMLRHRQLPPSKYALYRESIVRQGCRTSIYESDAETEIFCKCYTATYTATIPSRFSIYLRFGDGSARKAKLHQ